MIVGHIGINVRDIEVSKKFYQNIFDFEVMVESAKEGKKYAFLGNDGELLVTLWEQSDKEFSPTTAGLHHLAFVLEDKKELLSFEEKIEKFKVKKIYETVVSHQEGAKSGGLFFYDPDGTRLEVYVTEGAHECQPATDDAPSCGFF